MKEWRVDMGIIKSECTKNILTILIPMLVFVAIGILFYSVMTNDNSLILRFTFMMCFVSSFILGVIVELPSGM